MKLATILLGAALIAIPAAAFADSPREFLQKAMQGDNGEIQIGHLAQDRAVNPDVREYGRTLANDHSQARDEVLQVGRRFGLRPDRRLSDDARDNRDRLMRLYGRAFDREFVRLMIEDHRKDIGDFRDETRERHGAVSDLAARQLPTLQKHLDIALGLESRMGRGDDRNRYDDRNDRGRYGDRDNRYH